MSLTLRKTSQWWYGYYRFDGHEQVVSLGIRVQGLRPKTLAEVGDALFEQSRGAAQIKHDEVLKELLEKRNLSRLTERLIEIKTGAKAATESVPLEALAEQWAGTRHKRGDRSQYAQECRAILQRFVAFLQAHHPTVKELLLVTGPMARAFMKAEESRRVIRQSRRVNSAAKPVRDQVVQVTARTWNNTFKLLKGAFRYLAPEAPAYKDYFSRTELKTAATVHREPYSPADLKAILEAAQADAFIRPIIVLGICTAMRRGDCCQIKWADVNFETRFVNVCTAKTKAKVWIPMFDLLWRELAGRTRGKSEFVFPEQAECYRRNPDEITRRVQVVLAQAGFKDAAEEAGGDGGDAVTSADGGEPAGRGQLHRERPVGVRRASVRDFHSFRVTWITLALAAGVPIEMVRKVTGHASVEVVLSSYFHPTGEQFRALLQTVLPAMIVGEVRTWEDQMREILERSTAATWEVDRQRLLELLNARGRAGSAGRPITGEPAVTQA